MTRISEYEVEAKFIEKLEGMGYEYVQLDEYPDVERNFKKQLEKFNTKKLIEKKGEAKLSEIEFQRVLNHVNNKTVYKSAQILRDKYVLTLDNGKDVYLEFFANDIDRNIYQVSHQITINKDHLNDVCYKNRYDVTVIINGLPMVQIELKRPGIDITEAINQINRYRKFSFRGLFRYLQVFVVSNSDVTKYFCNENEMTDGEGGLYNPIDKSLVFYWTDENNTRINNLNEFASVFFRKDNITDMIDKYMIIKSTEEVLMVMRPYQIYAVKAARQRVIEVGKDGYVFACTGSGKTLTSFKLAQLLRDEPSVSKVIFLVDRTDLDDQTISEYNSFEKDCVDNTEDTKVLVEQMEKLDTKMIVTTIQKMSKAIKIERYAKVMDQYKDKKVVFIIDECHRSQFGKMHGDIRKHFIKANFIGFTGTPIFEENKNGIGKTTANLFATGSDKIQPCIHRYMITNAIADGNVLRFSVEYQSAIDLNSLSAKTELELKNKGIDKNKLTDDEYCKRHNIDMSNIYHYESRIRAVAADILANHEKRKKPQGVDEYTALFAVDSIKTLGKYYDIFKELNNKREEKRKFKIAAIFSYRSNEDIDGEGDEHSQELLDRIIKDYNEIYETAFDLQSDNGFEAYRKDIMKRMKQKDLPQIDILLVVNMMLTGFDSKPLNTLYLDKNLVWHGLVQAYSRTNRVYKITKQFGKIVTYRNLKKKQDEALALFSGLGDPNAYLLEPYEVYYDAWKNGVEKIREIAATPADAGQIQDEDTKRNFVLAFRDMATNLATMKTFSEFDWNNKNVEEVMQEPEYDSYKSWYLNIADEQKNTPKEKESILLDVDFNVSLIATDRINVVYILNLLKASKKRVVDSEEARKREMDLVLREIDNSDNETLRLKKELMKEFVMTRFYELPKDADINHEYLEFEKEKEKAEIETFTVKNDLKEEDIENWLAGYAFTGQVSEEEIRRKLMDSGMSIFKITHKVKDIKQFVETTHKKYQAEREAI